jgi:hypothetical protein
MMELYNVPAICQLRVAVHIVAAGNLATGDPARLKERFELVRIGMPGPVPDDCIKGVLITQSRVELRKG